MIGNEADEKSIGVTAFKSRWPSRHPPPRTENLGVYVSPMTAREIATLVAKSPPSSDPLARSVVP